MSESLEFRLTIRLGNDAMRTNADLSNALEGIARELFGSWGNFGELEPAHARSVMDGNGNRVGQWKIEAQS